AGMIVTGEGGVAIHGPYARGAFGRALLRRDLDQILLQHAIDAGCDFEPRVTVRSASLDVIGGARMVTGVSVAERLHLRPADNSACTLRARVTIAADGRRSPIAFGLGIARHPARPRRWAVGGYLSGDRPLTSGQDVTSGSDRLHFGELHVRKNCYIGGEPGRCGLNNVWLVRLS